MNHLQLLYIRVHQLKASFVRAQNIAAIWNHCPPWQFWSNSFNFSAGLLKKRPDAFTLVYYKFILLICSSQGKELCDSSCNLYAMPTLRIARLAVNRELQGNGIGKWLLSQVFIKTVQIADITGLYLIIKEDNS